MQSYYEPMKEDVDTEELREAAREVCRQLKRGQEELQESEALGSLVEKK